MTLLRITTLAIGLLVLIDPLPALGASPLGFTISVDGKPVAGDIKMPDPVRATDVGLADTDIQVKFDGLGVRPMLNALPTSFRRAFHAGEPVEFLVTSNYPAWIERAEIRIQPVDETPGGAGPLVVIPAGVNGFGNWIMPAGGAPQFVYVGRVYDAFGHYDETAPLPLRRTDRADAEQPDADLVAAGWGEDRTASRTIPVFGGAVTVYGTNVPAGARVVALGEPIPIDRNRAFVVQRILPSGDHVVDVSVQRASGAAMLFNRDINIPSQEWFYVAMADLTAGERFGSGKLVAANPEEFDNVYLKGRLAFYLKGKIKGEYLLTASADTGEGPVSDLFTGMLSKDPQALLRRIDPNEFYPVYGDDSSMVDDAPTRGKLYVRLERGPSHVMWGTFRTEVGNSAFLNQQRVLYGASAVYKSDTTTTGGERAVSASAYAAAPGTLPARDVLRGTGGSAYFLRQQDIVIGSETVGVEIADSVTGLVTSRRTLVRDTDYRINYLQGVVILNAPLQSTAVATGVVQSSDGDVVNLVAQYEYTPADMAPEDYSLGGNAEVWLGDHVAVGASAVTEKSDLGDRRVITATVRAQASDTSYLEAELAHSQGAGIGDWLSTDGGLNYLEEPPAGPAAAGAYAYRLNGRLNLAEVSSGAVAGVIGATLEGRQAGFAAADQTVLADQLIASTFASLDVGDRLKLDARLDSYDDAADRHRQQAAAELRYQIDPFWEIALGASYLNLADPGVPGRNGQRADLGARLTYTANDDLQLHAFAQATTWHQGDLSRNDRIGVGADWQLTDALSLGGEVSYGTRGLGGLATITHQQGADHRTYFGYRLTPDNDGILATDELSGFVVGTVHRYDDVVAVHAENSFSIFTARQTLTRTYGVTLTPNAAWTIDGGLETGEIDDPDASDFDRTAASLLASYGDEHIKAHLGGEVRLEASADGTRDRQTYLPRAGFDWQTSPDWRLVGNFDGVISNSDQAAILDGDYVEASLGFAYRPVDNERLNALFRYTYLYDLPGPDQVTASGSALGPAQRSNVLSIDANYDLNEFITIGGKYGFRLGEVSADRSAHSFIPSSAHLAVARVDFEVLSNWDILLEGRAFYQPEIMTTDLGALAAVYVGAGNNLKIGAGYNFGRFSDDLTDLVQDDHGVFFNLIAKY